MPFLKSALLSLFVVSKSHDSSANELVSASSSSSNSPLPPPLDDTMLQEALMISGRIRDQYRKVNDNAHRDLQVSPEKQCELFNQVYNGTRTCECERYDRRDTKINCTFVEEQCSGEGPLAACYDGSLIIIQDRIGGPRQVTSCINITSGDTRLLNTCVTVDSVEGKNMTEIAGCSATLNGERCNYCHHCGDRTLTVDCCNVVQDTKQEQCLPVSPNGGFTPFFPAVTDPGQCKGSYGYSSAPTTTRQSSLSWVTHGLALVGATLALSWLGVL